MTVVRTTETEQVDEEYYAKVEWKVPDNFLSGVINCDTSIECASDGLL